MNRNASRTVIELHTVTKVYPMGISEVRALDGVSLRVNEGEFVAIIGSSGSGKSTMMHLIGCLDRPTGGSIKFGEQTISGMNDRRLAAIRNRSVGFVFQTFNLISRMSAWENVAVPLFYARETITKPRALAALDRVGLKERAGHQPNELSGGERQRVAIARAIVNNPRLILADEPTGNLDSRTGEQIMQIFHSLHAAGTTIILVTHEREVAEQAERIITMRDGLIIDDRPSPRMAETPGSPESQAKPLTMPVSDSEPFPARQPAAAARLETASAASNRYDADPSTADPVLHPNAKRALIWTLAGPGAVAAFVCWNLVIKFIRNMNPGFAQVVGPTLWIALLALVFVAPILGFIHGRKGARWVRMAPAKFTGLRMAIAAQWVSGIYLFGALACTALLIAAFLLSDKLGLRPR
jgi:putative ABC transport system ATP-binding protein